MSGIGSPSSSLSITSPATIPSTPKRRVWRFIIVLICVAIGGHVALEFLLRRMNFVYYEEKGMAPGSFPDSATVILAVGDSSTFGYGTDYDKLSYPAQLERLLRQRAPGQDCRVVKMGFPGANTSELARRFEGFLNLYRPDVLVLLTGNNDIWNLTESRLPLIADNASWGERWRARLVLLADDLRVVRFYRRLWLVVRDRRKNNLKAMKNIAATEENYARGIRMLGRVENVQRIYEFNIGRMLDLARARGIETIVLDYNAPSGVRETAYLKPALKKLGVDMVDLEPHFAEALRRRLPVLDPDGWHATDVGYAIFARTVFNELVRRGKVHATPFDAIVDDSLAPVTGTSPEPSLHLPPTGSPH